MAARADTRRAIDAVWRIESARVIGGLARIVHDLGWAEDLAQDALVAALEQWPQSGIPDNPGAWLMATAKHRAIDQLRRQRMAERRHDELGRREEREQSTSEVDLAALADDEIGDDLLSLLFATCHPMLSAQARAALTLRLFGGLSTPEIARAFLVSEATVAQRVVRAKRTLAEARVPLDVPTGAELGPRLASVLEVIYLIFNEGYSATSGEDWLRPELCAEALRLGRVLAALTPAEPEVLGLVALMEFQSSRLRARIGPTGTPVLLLDQDRRTWDRLHIGRGEDALARATALGEPRGPYTLQAEIAACHARVFRAEETDWHELVALYGELARTAPSPIVELNRAVAVSMASGPEVALDLVDQLVRTGTLERYQLLPSVRGDLLDRLRRPAEAAIEFDRAAALATNTRERTLSEERARACRARAASVDASSPLTKPDGAS
jgi:RNA polymerase sigma factor (sigma-70 family)